MCWERHLLLDVVLDGFGLFWHIVNAAQHKLFRLLQQSCVSILRILHQTSVALLTAMLQRQLAPSVVTLAALGEGFAGPGGE